MVAACGRKGCPARELFSISHFPPRRANKPYQSIRLNVVRARATFGLLAKPKNARQFSFRERQLSFDIVLKASYLGNLGRDLDIKYNINQPSRELEQRELLCTFAPGVVGDDYAATDVPPQRSREADYAHHWNAAGHSACRVLGVLTSRE